MKIIDLYVPEKNVLVVKGQEVPTKQGHLLVLGLKKEKDLGGYRTLEETIKEAKDNNGILVADHPFYNEGIGSYLNKKPDIIYSLDAIETHNGEAALWIPFLTTKHANKKAQDFYSSNAGCGAISTSDGHSLNEIGISHTNLKMPLYDKIKDSDELTFNLRTAIRNSSFHDACTSNSRIATLNHFFDLSLFIVAKKLNINPAILKKI